MAYIKLTELITLGLTKHTHTSYQLFKDPAYTDLIIENIMDDVNLTEWHFPLYKEDGTFYNGEYPVYARVRTTANGTTNEWFEIGACV